MTAVLKVIEKNKTKLSKYKLRMACICLMVFYSSVFSINNVFAENVIQLEKGSIIGNSESPKATFIVPWREITPVEIKGLEIGALLDEELKMIKPEVFRRQVELHQIQASLDEKMKRQIKNRK